jgi:hypothetical protein
MIQNQIKTDEEGFPDWEPVSFYDAPATIITQIYDGEGSLGRAARTILDQSSLSPKERDSYVQRIKESHGGNPALDTVIDIAMNPLTWLLVVTNPVTAKQFRNARGRMLGGVSEMGKVGRKIVDALRGVHALGSAFMNEHAVTSKAINHLASRQQQIMETLQGLGGKSRGKMLQNLTETLGEEVWDFDHTRYSGEKKRKISLLNKMLAVGTGGFFKDDAIMKHQLVDLPRIGVVSGPDGEHARILPPLPKGEGERVYVKGAKLTLDGQLHELVDRPLVVNSEETYAQGKRLLGHDFDHLTIEEVPILNATRLPITREEGMQLLADEGFDVDTVKEYMGAVKKQQRHLASLGMGKTIAGTPITSEGPFVVDTDKILHSIQYFKEEQGLRKNFSPAEQEAFHDVVGTLTENILPDWVESAIAKNTITKTRVNDLIKRLYEPQLNNPHYYPRSLANQWMGDKNAAMRVEPYDVARMNTRNPEDNLKVRSAALLRERPDVMLDHGDLAELRQMFDGRLNSEQQLMWDNLIDRTDRFVSEQIKANKVASTLPLDFERAGRAYEQKMIGQAMMYGDDIPEHLLNELEEVKKIATRVPNEGDRTVMPLGTPTRYRAQTLKNLGITEKTMESISFGDASYPTRLKYSYAARQWREELDLVYGEMHKTTDPRKLETLERKRKAISEELDFIGQYRMPFASTQQPRSMGEFLRVLMPRENKETQELVDGFILPRLFGGAQGKHAVAMTALQASRTTMQKFVNSSMGKMLRDSGGTLGRNMFDGAQAFAERPVYIQDAANLSRNAAGYLYSTHLSSIMTGMYNAFQPFTWGAAWIGVPEVLKAYPKVLKQMANYERERVKYGLIMDPQQKRDLFRKHVPLANYHGRDLTMLNEDFLSTLDSAIFSGRVQRRSGIVKTIFMDMPLKFFQKVETMNRIVMAEAGLSFYEKQLAANGMRMAPMEIADNVQTLQSMANFAPQATTKPRILSDPSTGAGFLANPTMGMLLQYPLRFATNIATSGMVFGGKRSIGLQKFGGPELFEVPAQVADISRVLGVSAIMYEVGKNLMGLDLSPGLGAQSAIGLTDTATRGWMPVPVDIAVNLTKGLLDDDKDSMRRQVFRLLPAGIPLSKALGALPSMDNNPVGMLQSQYADWTNPNQQGMIPVYKDDGTLQSFESPLALVLKGVGFDPRKYQSPQEATKFLLSNRQQIVDMKRQYKDAVLGNNMAQAARIEQEYKTRFGIGMTVKPDEWDSAIKLREVSVSERMVDAMPADVRGAFQQSLGGPMAQAMGLPDGGLYMGDSAKQRNAIRQFSSGLSNPSSDEGS